MKVNKVCQSCGMPLKSDPQGGGTESNGSKSNLYCSYCYQRGKFTQPNLTVEEMQSFIKGKMKSMGFFMGLMGGLFVKTIPQLQRWRKTN